MKCSAFCAWGQRQFVPQLRRVSFLPLTAFSFPLLLGCDAGPYNKGDYRSNERMGVVLSLAGFKNGELAIAPPGRTGSRRREGAHGRSIYLPWMRQKSNKNFGADLHVGWPAVALALFRDTFLQADAQPCTTTPVLYRKPVRQNNAKA